MAQLTCLVVTPEQTSLETTADSIVLPLFDGEVGIYPGRAPLIGRLGYGEMRVKNNDRTSIYYLDGGFVQVANNVVSVLTSKATPAEKIDVAAAETQLTTAKNLPAPTDEQFAVKEKTITQARAQIRAASHAKR